MSYIGKRYKTGQTSDVSGRFKWDGYLDGTSTPSPTTEEKEISLTVGETFPPINSCDKGAWWKYVG